MNNKFKIAAGVIIIMTAIIYIISSGLQKTMIPFLSITEFVQKGMPVERLKLTGFVMPGTIEWSPDKLSVKFGLGEGNETVVVRYKGVTSDVFGEGIDVVVEGEYNPEGFFSADTIITKCPSKYEERIEEPEAVSADSTPKGEELGAVTAE